MVQAQVPDEREHLLDPPAMRRNALLCALLLTAACGSSKPVATTAGRDTTNDPPLGNDAAKPPADPARAAREQFSNPGGKWMPRQIKDHAAQLTALGLEIDPGQLSDPMAAPLNAVVALNGGGCTGSLISGEGLIVTNHHCVQKALQVNST